MSLLLRKSADFKSDVGRQFDWFFDEAGENIAWKFYETVELTLSRLSEYPQLGRARKFRHPTLHNLRSMRIDPPFGKILIFYRWNDPVLEAWRLVHGARDLGRRLLEPSERV